MGIAKYIQSLLMATANILVIELATKMNIISGICHPSRAPLIGRNLSSGYHRSNAQQLLTYNRTICWLAGLDLVRKLEICIISISHLTACVLYCVFRSRHTYAVFFVVVRWLVTTTIYPPILRLTESEKPLVCGTELNGAAVVNRPHSPIL